jgi:hypothetical protein
MLFIVVHKLKAGLAAGTRQNNQPISYPVSILRGNTAAILAQTGYNIVFLTAGARSSAGSSGSSAMQRQMTVLPYLGSQSTAFHAAEWKC